MSTLFEKSYDVVVCGGGIAGAAAAIASARCGRKTALIEKTVFPGGLATTGLIYIYLPLCDGNGTQVTFGIAEEFLHAAVKYGPGNIPDWQNSRNAAESQRYRTVFSPASLTLALDEILINAGVEVWLDTLICAANSENNHLNFIEVENKSGRGKINARCFIDATGDADIAYQAGLTCHSQANSLAAWHLEYIKQTQIHSALNKHINMHMLGFAWDSKRETCGIDGAEVSHFVLDGRQKIRERLQHEYAQLKNDRNSLFPLALPAMAQFRTTRHITAQYRLPNDSAWSGADDSIGMVADWRKAGLVWEVPFRCMLPVNIKNLIAAGRCIDAASDAWEVIRVIPCAALTGEAAGTAAALSVAACTTPDRLDIKLLQQTLRLNHNKIHFDELAGTR